MRDKLGYPFMIFSIFLMFSCGYDNNELTSEEKYAVDTIFNNQLNDYRKYVDSICIADKDTLYSKMVDSLTKEGMKDIDMLLMKSHTTE